MSASSLAPGARVARGGDVLHRVVEGEAVLVDLATGTYFGLNETGTAVWEALREEGATLDEIAAALEEGFDVDRAAAARDARALLERLAARGLVRVLPPARG